MTREKQIMNVVEDNEAFQDVDEAICFQMGAKWADENPSETNLLMVKVLEYAKSNLQSIKNMTFHGYTNNEKAAYYLAEETLDTIKRVTNPTSS